MQVTTAALFLVAMALIFSVPCLIWRLGHTEYYAPLVVVLIITASSSDRARWARRSPSTTASC